MKMFSMVLLVCVWHTYSVTACCLYDNELKLVTALKGMKDCKKCFLLNLLKPYDCKLGNYNPYLPKLPKLFYDKEFTPPCLPPYSPLVFLLPSPGAQPPHLAPLPSLPALPLHQAPALPLHHAPAPYLQAPPPAFTPALQVGFLPPPPAVLPAPPCLPPPPACPPPPYYPAPLPPPTCQSQPLQQVFYLPQPAPTCPSCPQKQSPLLYLSDKKY